MTSAGQLTPVGPVNGVWEVLRYGDPHQRDRWRTLCARFPDIDIQFYPEYAYLFELNGDGEACCFVYHQSAGELVLYPFLRRRINELPGFGDLADGLTDITVPYGYGGYLRNSRTVDMAGFYEAFEDYCRSHLIVSEFVRFHPLLSNQDYSPPGIAPEKWNDTVTMDLSVSDEDLWQRLEPACRSSIRKALRSGVRVEMDESLAGIEGFHTLYRATLTRLGAAPYYGFSLDWFRRLAGLLPSNAVLGHAYVGSELIASALFLFSGRHMHYFLAGSEAARLNLCPNNLLLYEAALWGRTRGVKCLHLGGGVLPEDSLFRFKRSFSPLRAPFYIGRKVHHTPVYDELTSRRPQDGSPGARTRRSFPGYRALPQVNVRGG